MYGLQIPVDPQRLTLDPHEKETENQKHKRKPAEMKKKSENYIFENLNVKQILKLRISYVTGT